MLYLLCCRRWRRGGQALPLLPDWWQDDKAELRKVYFDPLRPLPHELVALQATVPRGFNSALYKLPFVLDDELANLSRFGVERASTGSATATVDDAASSGDSLPIGGWGEAGDLLSSLPGLATALLTPEDVAAALGGEDPDAPLLPPAADPFNIGVHVPGLDSLSPHAAAVLGAHAGKDSGFLAAVLAGVDLSDGVATSQGGRELLQVLSTPRPSLDALTARAPSSAVLSRAASTAASPTPIAAAVPVPPGDGSAGSGSGGGSGGGSDSTPAASLRGIMTEPVDDDFWRSSSDEEEEGEDAEGEDEGVSSGGGASALSPSAAVVAAAVGGRPGMVHQSSVTDGVSSDDDDGAGTGDDAMDSDLKT